MGTRADFYVGQGPEAEWLGSIGWDGYPDGIPMTLRRAKDEGTYRQEVTSFLASRRKMETKKLSDGTLYESGGDATLPEDGWPWPWEDSRTTDYAYAFNFSQVVASCYGHYWFPADAPPEDHSEGGKVAVFPNMRTRQATAYGARSGLMVFGTK